MALYVANLLFIVILCTALPGRGAGFAESVDEGNLGLAAGETVLEGGFAARAEDAGPSSWTLTLPAGWQLVRAEVPSAVNPPMAGATGTLEWRFDRIPRAGLRWAVVLRHPAGQLSPVFLQIGGTEGGEPFFLPALRFQAQPGTEAQALQFPSPGNATYGDTPLLLGATLSSGRSPVYTVLAGPGRVIDGQRLQLLGAGRVTVRAGSSADARFAAAEPVDREIEVQPKSLYVIAEDASRMLGAINPYLKLRYEGFVAGESEAVLDVAPTLATPADALSPVGTYPITVVGGSDGNYRIVPLAGSLRVTPRPVNGSRLVNFSLRTQVGEHADTSHLGLALRGTDDAEILFRAVGPTLDKFKVVGFGVDPRLALRQPGGELVAENDNWEDQAGFGERSLRLGAFPLVPDSKDSVLLRRLEQGNYILEVGNRPGLGDVLTEAYLGDAAAKSLKVVNLSSLGPVAGRQRVMIAGFVVEGPSPLRLLLRGIGPELKEYGVDSGLSAPELELFDSRSNRLWSGRAWGGSEALQATMRDSGAFVPKNLAGADAMLDVELDPGSYTVQLSGVEQAAGLGLIEIYEVPVNPWNPPVILSGPVDQQVMPGAAAHFDVVAEGTKPLIFQWQRSVAGDAWEDLSDGAVYDGTRSPRLEVLAASAELDGQRYRCRVTNGVLPDAVSSEARLGVWLSPVIMREPASVTVAEGGGADFFVEVAGPPGLSYQWQRRLADGAWGTLASGNGFAGVDTASLRISPATLDLSGVRLRVVISHPEFGQTVSAEVVLTVDRIVAPPSIASQPMSVALQPGQTATFSLSAVGIPLPILQWQRKPAGQASWLNLVEDAVYSGVRGPVLTVRQTALGMDGDQFRCQLDNGVGAGVVSSTVTLTIIRPPVAPAFVLEPKAVVAASGDIAEFVATATGYPVPTYRWQISSDGLSWTNLADGGAYSGTRTDRLRVGPLVSAHRGKRVRCLAGNGVGVEVGSRPAWLEVMNLRTIPAGVFTQGDGLELGYYETPLRNVTVSAFRMADVEVTWGHWQLVRDWAVTHGYSDLAGTGAGRSPDHPVNAVTWYAAVKWLNAKSEMEGLEPVYRTSVSHATVYRTGEIDLVPAMVKWTASGYRLPTEAEWERAGRGGLSGRRFPRGDLLTHTEANYLSVSTYPYDVSLTRGYTQEWMTDPPPYTAAVASFPANGFGLHDMAGNVAEWCWDWFDPYTSVAAVDPTGPVNGNFRVLRGGSWFHRAWEARVAGRSWNRPNSSALTAGFRVVRSGAP